MIIPNITNRNTLEKTGSSHCAGWLPVEFGEPLDFKSFHVELPVELEEMFDNKLSMTIAGLYWFSVIATLQSKLASLTTTCNYVVFRTAVT